MDRARAAAAAGIIGLVLLALPGPRSSGIAAGGDSEETWGGGPLIVQWKDDPGRSITEPPRLIPGGIVVVTTDRKLCCYDLATGKKRWRRKFKESIPVSACGLSDPATGDRVFVFHGEESGRLRCLDAANGHDVWVEELDSRPTQLAAGAGEVWTLGIDGRLTARSAGDGREIWNYSGLGWDAPGFRREGTRLYVLARSDSVHALDAGSGERLWSQYLAGMFAAPPRLLDGELVCTSTEGTLRRLDPDTGTVLGEEDRDALQLYPALEAGGRIVTASTAGVVEARGPGGSWTYDADGAISAEPVAAGRVVLVPTAQGELVALRTDSGEKAWSLGLSGELRVPPILTDQRLILATNRGELYVYEHSR